MSSMTGKVKDTSNGIEALASPLSFIFKSFLIHGHISTFLLLCALIPIVKDQHGDKTSSSNYRAIAISSIIMKIFDHILIILLGDKLAPSDHQFGFMKHCSTTMCSFVVTECINYFTNRKTAVYCCLLDLTKAFDKVEFCPLFRKLWGRLPSIFLRLLIFSYTNQECLVKWNNAFSHKFPIKNGVRQGAVASPVFFSIYLDELFNILEKSNLGCHIGPHFFGLAGYADDCAILSPDKEGLQKMLNICKVYFDAHKIIISTNLDLKKIKTKCIAFGSKIEPEKIKLNDGRVLPFVDSWPHLGFLLHNDRSPDHDLMIKRGKFIGKLHSLRQQLGNIDPIVHTKLISIYLTSFYGSSLWDIFSDAAERLYKSWNIMTRISFNITRETRTFFIEPITESSHLKQKLMKRFIKFHKTLSDCDKPHVRYLKSIQEKDSRSTFGKNVMNISNEFGGESIEMIDINSFVYSPVPEGEEWKIPLLKNVWR